MATVSRLRVPAWAQDVLVAAFVTLFQIRGTLLVGVSQHQARPLAEPGGAGYALLAFSGVALLARRRFPVAVFAAVSGASAVYYSAHYPDGPGWLSLFVALYTLTALGDGKRSVRIVLASLAGLTVVWLLNANLAPLNAAGWVFFRIGAAIMAAALGESVRGRRRLAEQAQERAEHAERTKEEEARQRVDAERLRIAREVHDTVAHAIAIINVHAGVTAHVLDKRPHQAHETLVMIEQTSARALRELRTTLGMLRDTDDDRRAPTPGLGQLDELTALAREAGLDVKVEVDGPSGDLPSAVDHAAYRILQESITNAIRHAGPVRLTICIGYLPGELLIQVTDDGDGSRARSTPVGGGQGIIGMRERAALLGGSLVAGASPGGASPGGASLGGGFQVTARLPLPPDRVVRS
jgi:signal transduction histidine kinase